MASSVSTTFHGLASGATFTPAALRSGLISRAGVVQDGSIANTGRPGILPGALTPLNVTQSSTPAMTVKVKAGTVFQTALGSPGGMYSHTLTSDTDLTIATSPGSNSRWDVVVAKVFDDGVTPVTTIEVLTGAAAASPTYPSALTSPPANTSYYPLAKVVVGTSVSSIVNANISKPAAAGGLPTFGQSTVSPGGLVPVATPTDGAGLPSFSAFVTPGGEWWLRYPTGVNYQLGNMQRYLEAAVTTDVNGDFTVVTNVYTAGVRVPSPFPNGCKGAVLFDAINSSSFDEPVLFKLQTLSSSAVQFRAYRAWTHTAFPSANITVSGLAWGW